MNERPSPLRSHLPPDHWQKITTLDAHTAGEPLRSAAATSSPVSSRQCRRAALIYEDKSLAVHSLPLIHQKIFHGIPLGEFYSEMKDEFLVCATETKSKEDLDRFAVRLVPTLLARSGLGLVRMLIVGIAEAPALALQAYGVLRQRRMTCLPSASHQLLGCTFVDQPVVVDGNCITAQGSGAALTFALALVALPLYLLLRGLKEPYALNTLVVTFGLALLLQNLMLVMFSADYRLIRPDFPVFAIPGANFFISASQIILVVLSLLATGVVHVVLHYSFLGKALRATIQDAEAAQIAGINVNRMALIGFAMGGMLIGLAGPLYGENMYLYPTAGTGATLIAIILTIFAGVGRIRTLLLGGWLLGLVESGTVLVIGSKWRELVAAAVLLTLLVFRPKGIAARNQE